MPNYNSENVDTGVAALSNVRTRDDVLAFAGAGALKAGTILARVTASGKLTAFVKGGAGGAEKPVAILDGEASATGVADVAVRVAVAGDFRKQRLIIAADNSAANIDATVLDALRVAGLVVLDVQELGA